MKFPRMKAPPGMTVIEDDGMDVMARDSVGNIIYYVVSREELKAFVLALQKKKRKSQER